MPAASDRLEFAPPQQPGMLRAFGLAIVAHLLLLAALTWGINWKHDTENLAAEAELWSASAQQAAPRPAEAAPPPPAPQPAPTPAPRAEPPPQPVQRDADIALEREKQKRAEAREREEDQARQKKLEAQKKLVEQKKLAEQKKQEELKKQNDLKKQELAKKAEERKKADTAKQVQTAKQQQEDAKRLDALRQDNLRRLQGMAGATGSEDAKGTAARSSGPSDSYGGRIRARVRPNIVFSDDVAGNPTAEVEVRMAPDGTITSRRIVKSSGARAWDEAVLRALDKTEVLPRDVDGRVHSPLLIAFKFRD